MPKESTKDKVLKILDTHKGKYFSGQELADMLSVSRTAIWKAINALRDEKFCIEGSTKLGYTLAPTTDILNADTIDGLFTDKSKSFYRVECVDVTDSTNTRVRERGLVGEEEGLCIVATKQTQGRGRKGRSFYSPEATGLYLSILLRPKLQIADAALITTAAAVAGAKACEKVNTQLSTNDIKIKWVNDLFLNGRKICGILTEASLSLESHGLDFAVMGIGFNLSPPVDGWPDDIANVAGTLFPGDIPTDTRNKLTAAFLNEFLDIYEKLPQVSYLDEYRRRQLALGKNVSVISSDGSQRQALAIDVNDKCELLVRFEGEDDITPLNSGEISIKA